MHILRAIRADAARARYTRVRENSIKMSLRAERNTARSSSTIIDDADDDPIRLTMPPQNAARRSVAADDSARRVKMMARCFA